LQRIRKTLTTKLAGLENSVGGYMGAAGLQLDHAGIAYF